MKSYTLSWRHSPYYGSTLSRCRFEPSCLYWSFRSNIGCSPDVISAFAFAVCKNPEVRYSFRLTSCGRLIARSATYLGV